MNKKKIAASILALTLAIGIIGTSYAWFTSKDEVTNVFTTGGNIDENDEDDDGVDIWEEFIPPTNLTPGTETTKLVQTKNTSTYDAFIRVKITKSWNKDNLDTNLIELNFGDNQGLEEGKWYYNEEDKYYYYMGKVASNKFTNPLLETVVFSTNAGNEYKNAQYEVKIEAEAIQANNEAFKAVWNITNPVLTSKLDTFANGAAIGNDLKAGNTTDTIEDRRENN